MIKEHRIDYFEFERQKEKLEEGGKINVKLESVKAKKEEIEIDYDFTILYKEKSGHLKMKGTIFVQSNEPKKVAEEWKKTKKLPLDIENALINEILNFNRIRAAGVLRALSAKIEIVKEPAQQPQNTSNTNQQTNKEKPQTPKAA